MAERRFCPLCHARLVGMEATRRICAKHEPERIARLAAEEAKLPKCADCGGPIYLSSHNGVCVLCAVKREQDDDERTEA